MLEVKDLRFSYDGREILRGVSFGVDGGTLCGLFGPNGCGKTTLFKCCLRHLEAAGGSVLLDGDDTGKMGIAEMARRVAYVPQEHKPPFPYLVREVVLMGRTPHMRGVFGLSAEDRRKAAEAMDTVGVAKLANVPYNELSSGQRQMVLIARAIAQETRLIIMDEPTSALDFKNQMAVWALIRDVSRGGVTVLACSHDPNHVSWYCDSVIMMNGAGVVASGAPSEVMTESNLKKLYGDSCVVKEVDGKNVVVPSGVFGRSED